MIFKFEDEYVSLFDDTISALYDVDGSVSLIATDLKPIFDSTSKIQKIAATQGDSSYSFKLHTEDLFQLKGHESVRITFKDFNLNDVGNAELDLVSTSLGDISLKGGKIHFSLGELQEVICSLGEGDRINGDLSILLTRGGMFIFIEHELMNSRVGDTSSLDPEIYDSLSITGFLGRSNRNFYLSGIEIDGNEELKSIDVVEEIAKILQEEMNETTPYYGGIDPEADLKEILRKNTMDTITPEKAKEAVDSFKKENNMDITREQSIKLAQELLESVSVSPLTAKDLGTEELEKHIYKALDMDGRYGQFSHQELLKEASYLTYVLLNDRAKPTYKYEISTGKSYRTYEFGRVDSNTDPSKILFLVMEYPEIWKDRLVKV